MTDTPNREFFCNVVARLCGSRISVQISHVTANEVEIHSPTPEWVERTHIPVGKVVMWLVQTAEQAAISVARGEHHANRMQTVWMCLLNRIRWTRTPRTEFIGSMCGEIRTLIQFSACVWTQCPTRVTLMATVVVVGGIAAKEVLHLVQALSSGWAPVWPVVGVRRARLIAKRFPENS